MSSTSFRQPRLGRSRKSRVAVSAAAAGLSLGLVATACSSSSKSANSGTSATTAAAGNTGSPTTASSGSSGGNGSTITIGLLTPLTGAAASNYNGSQQSAQARVDAQNAQGGVNGHKLKLITADDTSSPTGSLTAAQTLVNKGAFAVASVSAFTFGSYKYLNQQGIPVTGGGVDGPEWGQQPNTNMFSYGASDPHLPQYTQPAQLMKDLGVTKVASVAYGVSPSSTAAAKGFMFAAKSVGLQQGYLNTSLPFGTVDVAPIALALKSTGSDGMDLPIDDGTAFAIITAAKQQGVQLKAAISATGYSQDLLDTPTAKASGQGVYFAISTEPVELHTPATTAMQAAFKQYANFTGVPNLNWYQGWISVDMIIKGLENAGANPTRQSWMSSMRQVTSYDANGLLGYPVNFSLANFGQAAAQSCGWYMKLTGSQFVPYPADGKPVCGTLIPNSNQA